MKKHYFVSLMRKGLGAGQYSPCNILIDYHSLEYQRRINIYTDTYTIISWQEISKEEYELYNR